MIKLFPAFEIVAAQEGFILGSPDSVENLKNVMAMWKFLNSCGAEWYPEPGVRGLQPNAVLKFNDPEDEVAFKLKYGL